MNELAVIEAIKSHAADFPYVTRQDMKSVLSSISNSEWTRIKRLQALQQALSSKEEEMLFLQDLCATLEKKLAPKGAEHFITLLRELTNDGSYLFSKSLQAILNYFQEELKTSVLSYIQTLEKALQYESNPIGLLFLLYDSAIDTPIQFIGLIKYLMHNRGIDAEQVASLGILHQYFYMNIAYQENIKEAYSLLTEADPLEKKLLDIAKTHTAGLRGQEKVALDSTISNDALKELKIRTPRFGITPNIKNFEGIYSITGHTFLIYLSQSNHEIFETFWKQCIKAMRPEELGLYCKSILLYVLDEPYRITLFQKFKNALTPETLEALVQQKTVSGWWLLSIDADFAKSKLNTTKATAEWLVQNPLSSETILAASMIAQRLTNKIGAEHIYRACFDFYVNNTQVDIDANVRDILSQSQYSNWYQEQELHFLKTLEESIQQNFPVTKDTYINIMDMFHDHKRKISMMRALYGRNYWERHVFPYPHDRFELYSKIIKATYQKPQFSVDCMLDITSEQMESDKKRTLLTAIMRNSNLNLHALLLKTISRYYPASLETDAKIKRSDLPFWKKNLLANVLWQEKDLGLQEVLIGFISELLINQETSKSLSFDSCGFFSEQKEPTELKPTTMPILARNPAAFHEILKRLPDTKQEEILKESIADENLLATVESLGVGQYNKALLNKLYEIRLRSLLPSSIEAHTIEEIKKILQMQTSKTISMNLSASERIQILNIGDLDYAAPFFIPFLKNTDEIYEALDVCANKRLIPEILSRKDMVETMSRLIKTYQDFLSILNKINDFNLKNEGEQYIFEIIHSLPEDFITTLHQNGVVWENSLSYMPDLKSVLGKLCKAHPENSMILKCLDMVNASLYILATMKLKERGKIGSYIIEAIEYLKKHDHTQEQVKEKSDKIINEINELPLMKVPKTFIIHDLYYMLSDEKSRLHQALFQGHPRLADAILEKIQTHLATYSGTTPKPR